MKLLLLRKVQGGMLSEIVLERGGSALLDTSKQERNFRSWAGLDFLRWKRSRNGAWAPSSFARRLRNCST